MKFTRDGAIWMVGAIGGALTNLVAYFNGVQELLVLAIPGFTADRGKVWQARIQLLAGLVGIVSGVLRMSPLSLSPTHEAAIAPDTTLKGLSSKPSDSLQVDAEKIKNPINIDTQMLKRPEKKDE